MKKCKSLSSVAFLLSCFFFVNRDKNSCQFRESSPKPDHHSEKETNDVSIQMQTTVGDDITSVEEVQTIDIRDDSQHSPINIDGCRDTFHDERTHLSGSSDYVPQSGPSIDEAKQQKNSESTKKKEV